MQDFWRELFSSIVQIHCSRVKFDQSFLRKLLTEKQELVYLYWKTKNLPGFLPVSSTCFLFPPHKKNAQNLRVSNMKV